MCTTYKETFEESKFIILNQKYKNSKDLLLKMKDKARKALFVFYTLKRHHQISQT